MSQCNKLTGLTAVHSAQIHSKPRHPAVDTCRTLAAVEMRQNRSCSLSSSLTFQTFHLLCCHDRAVLSACQKASESDDEKLKILFLIEALKLRPFALRDDLGLERHALAHQTVVDKLVLGQVAVFATDLPRKRRFVEDESRFASGLENLLAASP